jgi:hypothetical protein
MKQLSFFIGMLLMLSFSQEAKKVAKEVSAKDKEVIVEIFKTLYEEQYRFEFSKEESYGKKPVGKMSPASLRNGGQVTISNSIVKTYYPTMNFWFAVNNPKPPAEGLSGVFGKANAARLEAIVNKYTAGK